MITAKPGDHWALFAHIERSNAVETLQVEDAGAGLCTDYGFNLALWERIRSKFLDFRLQIREACGLVIAHGHGHAGCKTRNTNLIISISDV